MALHNHRQQQNGDNAEKAFDNHARSDARVDECPENDPFSAGIFRTAKGITIAQKWIPVQTEH
jgi:hypothetical protein